MRIIRLVRIIRGLPELLKFRKNRCLCLLCRGSLLTKGMASVTFHLQTSLFMKLSILDFVLSYLLKFSPSRDACNPLSTMASADFSSFVVTTASYSVSTADETSLGTTRFFPSIYLPHLLFTVPYSYWASICYAILPPYIAWCDFYSSDQMFAFSFLPIPPRDGHPCRYILSTVGRIWDFHPLETCAAGCTYSLSQD